ncbi:MAG: hypothetical protein AB7V18_18235 [Pyrinomonadaceae bacterium]
MTIDEISKTLPNGLLRLQIDFEHERASVDFAVDISNIGTGSETVSRRGRLNLSGLVYFVVEPPDETYSYDQQFISSDSSDFSELASVPKLPNGSFAHWFYLSANNFLYVAAVNAEFEWTE